MTLARVHEHGDARFVPWLEVTFEEKFPTEAFHHPADLLFPDGESILVVHARARETLQALAAAHAGETIAIVSHTWVIQPLLAVLAGAEPSSYYRFGLRYATTTLADVDQSGAGRVQMVNGALDLHEVAGGRLVAGRQTEATRVGGGSPP
jgi:broad specificity phosphatase PhoE